MGLTSLLCLIIGVYPRVLYDLLPYPVQYDPYSAYHLSETVQILLFTGLGFFLLVKKLSPEAKINLDFDLFRPEPGFRILLVRPPSLAGPGPGLGRVLSDRGPADLNVPGPLFRLV